jgi:hypothetical protein
MLSSMKYILTIAAFVLVAGCASTGSIQFNLQGSEGELTYLHDSTNVANKNGSTLRVKSFVVDDVLPPSTTVQKTAGSVLPFLFVNTWEYDYQSSLGYEQIKNNYKKFIQESFVEELKRSGKFRYVEDKGNMEIDIKIKKVHMSAPIHERGNFLFLVFAASFGEQTTAGPVDVVVMADAILTKNGKTVFSKEFQGKGKTNVLNANYTNKRVKLLEDYTLAMIEGLSVAIKNLNENIVKEINTI